jgi:hypothetical protein
LGNKIKKNISNYKEDFVFNSFEVENGVLGLEQDIYLSVVKFLDSLTIKKVCFLIFLFVLFKVH